jgi:hypothetical protein
MNYLKNQDQETITLAQQDYLPILIDSFLTQDSHASKVHT